MSANNPSQRGGRHRQLYRTVLSLAVAAVLAATIPFSAIYLTALRNSQGTVTALTTGPGGKQVKLVTTASGRTVAVPAGTSGTAAAALTTRTSSGSYAGEDQ